MALSPHPFLCPVISLLNISQSDLVKMIYHDFFFNLPLIVYEAEHLSTSFFVVFCIP